MNHVDMEKEHKSREKNQQKGSCVTGKEMRSLCASVKVYSDFALSHMGLLTLSQMGSHWRVPNRGVTWSDL